MRPDESPAVARMLAEAFQREDFAAWQYPDENARRTGLHAMFSTAVDRPGDGAVIDMTDDLTAAAIWLPPTTVGIRNRTWSNRPPVRSSRPSVGSSRRHPPNRSGIWPSSARGPLEPAGGRRCFASGTVSPTRPAPTAAWTGSERNQGFYARHGYRVTERLDFVGASAWWQWRDPRH